MMKKSLVCAILMLIVITSFVSANNLIIVNPEFNNSDHFVILNNDTIIIPPQNLSINFTPPDYDFSLNITNYTLDNLNVSLNQAPIFLGTPVLPSCIEQGDSHVFSVQVYDPDEDPITIEWYLDGELVSSIVKSDSTGPPLGVIDEYNFIAIYEKVYTITIIISDGELSDSIEFYVDVGGGGCPIRILYPIYSCQELDVENRFYRLENDITTSETCFIIKANNILLDLNGNSITGDGDWNTWGIYNEGYNNIIIQNGGIYNFENGIFFKNSLHNKIINIETSNNLESGIGFDNNLSYNKIMNCITQNNKVGVVFGADNLNNTLINSHIENNNQYGILFITGSNNNLIYNNFFSNTQNIEIIDDGTSNSWNIEKTSGTNIIGGPYLGGNYWANPDGTGFSETCGDSTKGICDNPYILNGNNVDYLPLAHTSLDENPMICNFPDNGNLYINIEDINVVEGFGDDDEWFPLDEIEVDIEIENNGDEKIEDIEVEWGLYDTEANEWVIELDDEKDFDLRSGKEKTIIITFQLDDNIDELEHGDFRFIVKATGEDDEFDGHKTCTSDFESIEVVIENDFVILDDIIITPKIVMAGAGIEITADVWNIGDDDQDDVTVRIYNSQLGIDKWMDVGDIDSFEGEKLETSILIPENASEGTYQLRFGVYNEDNDVYENDNDDEAIFVKTIVVEGYLDTTPPTIDIIMPADGSIIKGDFTTLMVKTNENAVCEYGPSFIGIGGGGSYPKEMSYTGGTWHSQLIEGLNPTTQDETYFLTVTCTDESGNSENERTYFYVDLSELREFMILEDIGDYLYSKSTMIEIPEGADEEITAMYFAYYDKSGDDYLYSAGIYEFKDDSYFDEFLDEFEEGISITIEEINGNIVYRLDEGDGDYGIFWFHENLIVYVMAAINLGDGTISETPLPVVEAYLEKYPSDLSVDIEEVDNPERGDVNKDGVADDSDIEFLINYLYKGGEELDSLELGDANNDGRVNILDVTYLINYLYKGGPAPVPFDTTSPTIELINPEDDYTKRTRSSSYEIDFEYKVSDESDIVSCSLIIDGEIEKTRTNIPKDTVNTFTEDLNRGSYDWKIKCVDSEGNKGYSETRDLRIKKKSSSSDDEDEMDSYYSTLGDISDTTYKDGEPIKLNGPKDNYSKTLNWQLILFFVLLLSVLVLLFLIYMLAKE